MVAVIAVVEMRQTQVFELRRQLEERRGKARGTHRIALPDSSYRLLLRIVHDLAEGKAISLTPAAQEMTTQKAAEFLGFSRQFLVRLLDEGTIPFHRVGTHRRVYLQDLISFRKQRDQGRHEAIRQMARDAVNDGVYDEF